jgi:hypothetical protein
MSLKTFAVNLFLKGRLLKFVYVLIGKKVAKELNLQEGKMDSKKWYQSKGVLTGIVTVIIGLYTSVDVTLAPQLGFDLPSIPEWIFVLLGAIGVYSRTVANTTIEK